MAYWIFKLANQELYPDVLGTKYVYDNTHSVKVRAGDVFLYLDKRDGYAFTATGTVGKLTKRAPSTFEVKRTARVHTVFTAFLANMIWFNNSLSISPTTITGKKHRSKLGIVDVNSLGWSRSIPSMNEVMYHAIMGLVQVEGLMPTTAFTGTDFSVPDRWAKTKVRKALGRFSNTVLKRHCYRCVVCGTELRDLIDAAHLSPFAADEKNRANPGNGVCLCTYCHRALDRRVIAICPDGSLLVANNVVDAVALAHFQRVPSETRREWLKGVDNHFLNLTVRWFSDSHSPEDVSASSPNSHRSR